MKKPMNASIMNRKGGSRLGVLSLVLTLVLGSALTAQTHEKVLITGAKIVPMSGKVLEKGEILIEYGRITAMGEKLERPFDAWVVDAAGKTIYPGAVDPMTVRGLDVPNETLDLTPFVEVYDAFDPSDRALEIALRNGTTTLHVSQGPNCVISGVSRMFIPVGLRVEEMTVRADGGLRINFAPKGGYDHAVQYSQLREAFDDLDRYLDDLAEKLYEADLEKKGEKLKVGPEEARKRGRPLISLEKMSDRYRNLYRLREGRLDAYIYCVRAMEVAPALAFVKREGLEKTCTFVLAGDTFKAAKLLKGLARPIIIPKSAFVFTEADRISGELHDTFTPQAFAKAKIPFAVGGFVDPWATAARLMRGGIPRAEALSAVTSNAAKAIGMEQRVGALAAERDGNLVMFTGDPLDLTTWVDSVWIQGIPVYERSKDKRLRDLLEGVYETKERERRAEAAKKAKAEKTSESKPAKTSTEKKGGKPSESKAVKKSAAGQGQ
ncbi:MAG TPA: hypothetical protein ENK43_15135 [Planctomycetes bacterium]|nr:hypothetical protein [Planctomycetota bacterium]